MLGLADWMGLKTKVIKSPSHSGLVEEFSQATRHGRVCVAAGADTLAQMPELFEALPVLSESGVEHSVPISMLVYGIGGGSSHITMLERLGCHSIKGVQCLQKQPILFRFGTKDKACLQQLAGLDFSVGAMNDCHVFEMMSSADNEVVPLLLAENHPVFVRTQVGERNNIALYLWATNHVANVGLPTPGGTDPESLYQWLLPAILYLKACFGPHCWHNPNVRARLIIDDPLLHPQYGFLRYDALLSSMRRVAYGPSLAFIPWNYRRSHKQVADLFLANTDLLSLCVHGCDHTNHEFDSDDEEHLVQIAGLALQRMKMHDECSGILHEKVMVFPQGHFSLLALRALRMNGFVAAVNSSCYPSREEIELSLGDLMLPAVCRFHGFPIFLRRDPHRIVDIAVDLFLGRAGFVVEHHEFAQDGYGKWEHFAAQMNALDERLSWTTLVDAVTETCLQKVTGDTEMEVRFYTPIFKWTNQLEHPILVRLSKCEPDPMLIKEIRVNGEGRPFHAVEGYVHFDAVVEGKASITVEILDKASRRVSPFKVSLSHQIRVGSRRVLSEFRDNTLARYPTWLNRATAIARHFKLTGDSK